MSPLHSMTWFPRATSNACAVPRATCSDAPRYRSEPVDRETGKIPRMVPLNELLLFAGAALVMVLTPGPNMIYLVSRSICQGRRSGVVSLAGVITGFLVHMLSLIHISE